MAQSQRPLQNFETEVAAKYSIYNSLFLNLPFGKVRNTGLLLPLLAAHCKAGFQQEKSPAEIIQGFFEQQSANVSEEEKISLLFRFVQYVERQIVLFDSLEDAAFVKINNVQGVGTLDYLHSESMKHLRMEQVREKLNDFKVRIVLTAHPTQFYSDAVLGIIHDLGNAIETSDLTTINQLLKQLGKTPFYNKKKSSPYDETSSLVWYLENVFYESLAQVQKGLKEHFFSGIDYDGTVAEVGFWPGGDRDGNPNVDAQTTLRVADTLRSKIISCYYRDLQKLERRLTFRGVSEEIKRIKTKIYQNTSNSISRPTLTKDEFLDELTHLRNLLIEQHDGLFINFVDDLLDKVRMFGYHFATLDIRQNSVVHTQVLQDVVALYHKNKDYSIFPKNFWTLDVEERMAILSKAEANLSPSLFVNRQSKNVFESIYAIKEIQHKNGERGANRYIISNCTAAINVLEVIAIMRLVIWKFNKLTVDIVPLFETIEALENAPHTMWKLFTNEVYRNHIKQRGNKQSIMVGFSDATKDGGYFQTNWAIYRAKEAITRVAREQGVEVIFFDGRGGPPARGGGKTNKFYASLGKDIENKEIQLTIQGQTISANFGHVISSQYNIEQLITAGVSTYLTEKDRYLLTENDKHLLNELALKSYEKYKQLRDHPLFLPYLETFSTLFFYGQANNGSRPSKWPGVEEKLNLQNVRAIPFVGSWSQLKQNVPGFYGIGTALKYAEEKGKIDQVRHLFQISSFFRTLLENAMMVLKKCFFPLTNHIQRHKDFSELWQIIFDEYQLSQNMLLKLTQYGELMSEVPASRRSVEMREQIVLPLLTIQQFALIELRNIEAAEVIDEEKREVYKKLIIRTLYGAINAGRNSV